MPKSPFPGMDPFLEDPAFWEGFHDLLIGAMMFEIEKGLPDGYISNVKERAELISIDDPSAKVYVPDIGLAKESPARPRGTEPSTGAAMIAIETAPVVIPSEDFIEVREAYIEIQRLPSYELVTVLELMSPWNKHGAGIGIHRGKRASHVRQGVHFVEVDLLRGGTRTSLSRPLPPADYYSFIFRADRVPDVDVFRWTLRDPLPTIPIPLRQPDRDVPLSLGASVRSVYEQGRYDRKLRYQLPLNPPLARDDAEWAESLILARR